MFIQQNQLAEIMSMPIETMSLFMSNYRFSKYYKKLPFKVGRRTVKKPCFEFSSDFITELIDYLEIRQKYKELDKFEKFVKSL